MENLEFKDLKDEEVVMLVQNGNRDAYGILIDRFEVKMIKYARRFFRDKEDITDLVQDVFVKAYININSFDSSKRFSPWIYRIAHNEFVNKIAWKSVRNLVSIDADEFFPNLFSADEKTEKSSIQREEKEIMEKYLAELDDKYKTPLILFFYEDLSYDEISEILKIPKNTVGIRILRGKEKLKALIEENDKIR